MKSSLIFVSVAAALAGATLSPDLQAATVERISRVNPTGACQSALPVFDGNIRKRPKAVQNEGSADAFVTCSFYGEAKPKQILVRAATVDGNVHQLSCQGVPGTNATSHPAVVKQAVLLASGEQGELIWNPQDWEAMDTLPSPFFSISCALKPGVGLNDMYVYYDEEIGD